MPNVLPMAIVVAMLFSVTFADETETKKPEEFPRVERQGELEMFPCSDCHAEQVPNPTRRKLVEEHDNIELKHGGGTLWCLDCHAKEERDSLALFDGTLVSFNQTERLCGKCHGPKLRDWRLGIHGRRTGYWNGEKTYLLCATCHNPHDTPFKPIKPEPPPRGRFQTAHPQETEAGEGVESHEE